MDKAYLEKLDKSDYSRLKDIETSTKDIVSPDDFLTSKTAKETLNSGDQALIGGFGESGEILPSAIPFSDRVFVEICPLCACVKTPQLLLPYLERDLIIPVLYGNYAEFQPAFVELISSYPYLSFVEFHGLRNLILKRKIGLSTISQTEIKALYTACWSASKKRDFGPESTLKDFFTELEPYFESDLETIFALLTAIQNGKLSQVNNIFNTTSVLNQLRYSQVFPLIPQVKVGQLESLKAIPAQYNGINFQENEVRTAVLSGLKLSYNSKMDLGTYLDIVSERKPAIRRLVKDIVNKSNPADESYLTSLRAEIERINSEVRSLQSSTKALTVDVITNFLYQNKSSIVAGLITAASAGLAGLGLIGCGVAGLVSTTSAKTISKAANFSVPERSKALETKISAAIQPNYEAALAKVLSTDVQAIQLWHIQKKLSK